MSMFHAKRVGQIALASGLLLTTLIASAQEGTATANASATIINPIAIAKTTDLNFGKLAVGSVGGNVTVSTTNAVTINGAGSTVVQPLGNTGNPTAAVFAVSGEASFTYAVTLPADGTVSISDGASHTMAVSGFTSNPASSGTLSGAGADTLKVGATLAVGNNQTPGTYTGTFSVTVAYN
jgi:spore coat protein U-like protein